MPLPISAIVVTQWQDDVYVYLAVSVPEMKPPAFLAGNTEYIGKTTLRDEAGNLKPEVQLNAELIAACAASRDWCIPFPPLPKDWTGGRVGGV